jgi:hypothetical protein
MACSSPFARSGSRYRRTTRVSQVRSPTPPADVQLTEDLARRLVADQFPHYAHLPVRAVAGGWDNEMFRVGDHVAARLPRRQLGADLSGTEHHWLARVGSSWTFAVPLPVAVGEPGQGYPWRWSIVPWIEGTPLFDAPLSPEGAADLGRALAQVHAPPPPGAPLNPFRSSPLASRVDKLDERLATLAAHDDWTLDGDALRSAVVEADSADVATWCHLGRAPAAAPAPAAAAAALAAADAASGAAAHAARHSSRRVARERRRAAARGRSWRGSICGYVC